MAQSTLFDLSAAGLWWGLGQRYFSVRFTFTGRPLVGFSPGGRLQHVDYQRSAPTKG